MKKILIVLSMILLSTSLFPELKASSLLKYWSGFKAVQSGSQIAKDSADWGIYVGYCEACVDSKVGLDVVSIPSGTSPITLMKIIGNWLET